MNEPYREQCTEPLIGYVYLPHSQCRLRFAREPEPNVLNEKDIPIWAFTVAMVALAVLIGVCGALLLLPYGAICR